MTLTLFICADVGLYPGPKTLNFIISHFLTVIATVFLLMTYLTYIINQRIQYTPQF